MHTVHGVQRQKGSQNRMVKYSVKSNDTFESIAERFYGYARLGKPLSETNGYKDGKELKEGDEITLIHHIMAIDPDEPRHEGRLLIKSYPCKAKTTKGGATVHIQGKGLDLLENVEVVLKAGDEELYTGMLPDGILEIEDLERLSMTIECTHNGKAITHTIDWNAGEAPYPVQTIEFEVDENEVQ